jgi:hypothetical protein
VSSANDPYSRKQGTSTKLRTSANACEMRDSTLAAVMADHAAARIASTALAGPLQQAAAHEGSNSHVIGIV